MKFKETFKSILSTVLALTFILSAVPITTTFAAQSNEYVDPADVWMSANGRTNEFDMNATITYETQYCTVCRQRYSKYDLSCTRIYQDRQKQH